MNYLDEDYDPNGARQHEQRAEEIVDHTQYQVSDGETAIVAALLGVSARLSNLADALLTRQDAS